MEKEIKKELTGLRIDITFMLVIQFIMCILIMYDNTTTSKRLDAQKEVIELQQKQINQLIIHCEYERNK